MKLNRRSFVSGAALAAVASPFVSRGAFAQATSGEVNIFAWAGYISDELLAAFERDTGIKATYTPYGTNDELLNQMRASNGTGYDIIWPAVDRVPNYVEFGLIQPIDETKVIWDRVLPSALKGSETLGAVVDGKRYQVPTDWGTEALAFDTTEFPLVYGTASYGDLWKPEASGKATVRGHSALVGLGLWLETQGKLPHPMRDSFKDEATMRANYDVILAEAIERKGNIAQFWSNENEAQGAFRTNGAKIGQTWDSSAAGLAKEGLPIGFVAPVEGALAWMEGISIPVGAENVDQAYAFLNWMLTPEAGAMYANNTSINTTAVGADAHLSEAARNFFAAAYPGDALEKLWWWPVQENWFVTLRGEYQDKFLSA
ncbi:MAG: spermidine/putrescine ABC transporter substrate-binding protein [Cereibacter sphaeroides]|uniref:Spermidine/putrescine ABC transporter substrate-binding protein n=1 Tax=Cereibacter sphaeroides TaxID=1063 RepID=A0A2W5S4M2_CERSP|nr:MAG: spermidine/putrescine ABC transporter substrate-binding protein [Cereibacter sphaeroides]